MFVIFVTSVLMALGLGTAKASPLSNCKPIIQANGYPIGPWWVDGVHGQHVFFFCQGPAYEYTTGFSCSYDDCNQKQLSASIAKVLLATDKTAAIEAEWAAHIKWTCANPPDEPKRLLCVERGERAQAALDAALVGYVRPVYRVKTNGLIATRPAFTLMNGVIGQKEAGRATAGTVCDMTKPTAPATGGDIRAEYGTPGLVTICTKVNP
tara:strand:- start:1535 stop:2161 length:627 start_codon:yes stop_codon:yes gene_type:complete